MTKKEKVFAKFGGLCAYTGRPLGNDWQIDHAESKHLFEKVFVSPAFYKCKESGAKISVEEYQERTDEIIGNPERHSEAWLFLHNYKYCPPTYKPHPDCNKLENLLPALKIVNHYKRELDIEGFRDYMKRFHIRLSKLPKKTTVTRTIERKKYLMQVAEVFGITEEKPFDGIFYFEKQK